MQNRFGLQSLQSVIETDSMQASSHLKTSRTDTMARQEGTRSVDSPCRDHERELMACLSHLCVGSQMLWRPGESSLV